MAPDEFFSLSEVNWGQLEDLVVQARATADIGDISDSGVQISVEATPEKSPLVTIYLSGSYGYAVFTAQADGSELTQQS